MHYLAFVVAVPGQVSQNVIDSLYLSVRGLVVVELPANLVHRVAREPLGRFGGVQRDFDQYVGVKILERARQSARDQMVSGPRSVADTSSPVHCR